MDLGIEGKVAMVSGGSRGLGFQAALCLAREGCRVSICARDSTGLNESVKELNGMGYEVSGISADVATLEGANSFYQSSMEQFGRVDILVNNVGGTRGGRDFDNVTDQDWWDTIELNLMSAVRLTRMVVPGMKNSNWGRIVNVASIWGREYGGGPTYMTAKAALIAFSKHMAITLAPYGILVNSVAPGSIQFPGGSWDRFVNNNTEGVVREFIANQLPMGKFGWPEPVGDMIAYLCSDVVGMVTGTSINVDGGQSHSLI